MDTGDRLDGALLDRLWDFDDPAASVTAFRRALAELDAGSTAYAELRTQVARGLGLQHLEQDALAELAAVETAGPASARVTARVELERGRLDNSAGRSAAAVPRFEAAARAARTASDDFLLVDALHMLAIADADRSDDWTRQALTVAQASDDRRTRRWLGSLYNNHGWTLHDRGQFAPALAAFEAALDAQREHGDAERIRVAEWAVGRVLRSLGRIDEALAIQRRLAAGPADGYVEEELGELLLATGAAEAAAPHFAAAATALAADQWFDDPDRLARLVELSSITAAPETHS